MSVLIKKLGLKIRILISIWACFGMTSCNLSRYVTGQDQFLLAQQEVKVKKFVGFQKQAVLAAELTTLLKQRPIGKYLSDGRRNTWLYFRKKENPDTAQFQKWFYRKAQPPVYYDDSLTKSSIKNMAYYLQNKGYLHPSITYDETFYKKMADVTYIVDPGTLYVIDSVQFVCADTSIQLLLNDIADRSFLKKGEALDAKLYEQEVLRIVSSMENFGYAQFKRNFISPLESDTTVYGNQPTLIGGKRPVNLLLTVLSPNDKDKHIQYSLGEVRVFPNYHPVNNPIAKSVYDTTIAGKRFFSDSEKTRNMRLDRLAEVIRIAKNDRYSALLGRNAYKALDRLSLYKFIIIKPSTDDCDSNRINYDIQLTPHDKMSFDAGLELNYSYISVNDPVQNSSPHRYGIGLDAGFAHRNLFGGAENFTANLSAGVDFFSTKLQSTKVRTMDVRATVGLNIPKFLNISRLWTYYHRMRVLNSDFYRHIQHSGTTQFTISYSYANRIENFTLQTFDLNYKYGLKLDEKYSKRYNITPTGITLSLTNGIDSIFDRKVLENNLFLKKSLGPKLATGFLFKEYKFELDKPNNAFGEKWYFRSELEQSGSEIWLINYAYNSFKTPLRLVNNLKDSLPFSKYFRGEVEGRYTRNFGGKKELAIRLLGGMAVPFEDTKVDGIPFLKQFHIGGP
ncbi:MAG: hypothetical protein RL329_2291, partial [Bacteroidota bacterium]